MQTAPQVQSREAAVESLMNGWRGDLTWWTRHQAPKLAFTLFAAIILLAILRVITGRLQRFSQQPSIAGLRGQQMRTLAGVIESVGVFVIVFLAAMQLLPLFGVDVKPILASAGIVGLAVGFGAQTLVKDVINGFFILIENQYDVGDTVRVAGVTGAVEVMSLRKTTLRDATGALHIVPNSEIKVVSNLTRDWAQVALHISASYEESSERVVRLLQEVGESVFNDDDFRDVMVSHPEVPGIERVAGQEVDYLMVARVQPGQQYRVSRELRKRIIESFRTNQVKAAAPGRVYVLDGAPAQAGGDQDS